MEIDYTQEILKYLDANSKINDSEALAKEYNKPHQTIVGALKSLDLIKFVNLEQKEKKILSLTADGEDYLQKGFPEFRIFQVVPPEGISLKKLEEENKEIYQYGWQNALKKKWLSLDKGNVMKKIASVEDTDRALLEQIKKGGSNLNANQLNEFKKRKLTSEQVIKYYVVTKGDKFSLTIPELETDLTTKLMANDAWKDKTFKPYNWNALGKEISPGNLHPILKIRSQFRTILLEMGFEEMPTNNYVESSFWNFDALFTAQQHPCRDMQDTFFVSDPGFSQVEDKEYYSKVKEVHEKGGYGSIGWRYKFSDKEATSNIMRTHTTAFSTKMLYQLAKEKEFKPKKYFSIDRVFRNEATDATHLAEFHQIEGLIADKNIGLPELMGIIKEFYSKIGIENIKFKPAYNPYTEPSMEIFGYHPILKRWVEIANSGVFRPEMLEPMGLPKDVNVIAWGLALERPCMILYKYDNIRDLWGDSVPIKLIKDNQLVCFE